MARPVVPPRGRGAEGRRRLGRRGWRASETWRGAQPADADDQDLLNQSAGYDHETLLQSPEARARGLDHPELVTRFRLGYVNRTLGLRLSERNRLSGADIRSRLQKVGILRESGHEHFNGSLVVPVMDGAGNVTEMYGPRSATT